MTNHYGDSYATHLSTMNYAGELRSKGSFVAARGQEQNPYQQIHGPIAPRRRPPAEAPAPAQQDASSRRSIDPTGNFEGLCVSKAGGT